MPIIDLSVLRSSSVLGKLARLPLRLLPPNLVVPILQGNLRGCWWVVGSSVHGCWLGWYEREKQLEFARALRPGAVVYDIGANVGFYTLLSSVLVGDQGRVYAFEPVPRNVRYLRQHIRLNHLHNVEVLELAVGESAGEASFDDTLGHSVGRLSTAGRLCVEVATLDGLMAADVLQPPHVLKIDVEGAEAAVLTGALGVLRHHHPVIFLARNPRPKRTRALSGNTAPCWLSSQGA